MGELISQEELDRAFDARFPKEMQVKHCSDVSKKRDWKASAGGF